MDVLVLGIKFVGLNLCGHLVSVWQFLAGVFRAPLERSACLDPFTLHSHTWPCFALKESLWSRQLCMGAAVSWMGTRICFLAFIGMGAPISFISCHGRMDDPTRGDREMRRGSSRGADR